MVEGGKFLCDRCNSQIVLFEKPITRILIEFVRGGTDRHYCEICFRKMNRPSEEASKQPRRGALRRWSKIK